MSFSLIFNIMDFIQNNSKTCISCDICFNFDVIYPKQNITGNVAVKSTEYCILQQVIIEVSGTAECEWICNKHVIKSFRIYKKGTKFHGKQEFYLARHTLAGGSSGKFTLNSTPQIYPFKCGLPEYLPGTWKGVYGEIKYLAKVLIKRVNYPLYIFTREIIVKSRRNLQLEQYLLNEARQEVERNFRFSVINLGYVSVSLWLPICGIAAGQGIPLLCTIRNQSKVQFGGLIFVLTQIEILRSKYPTKATNTHRKDICRIPRMVDILRGTYEFYCILETDATTTPTNQYWCSTCQIIYEVWISLQASLPRYKAYGYPNIDTPGIPLIIGTKPLYKWDNQEITNEVMNALYSARPPVDMEPLPPDDEVEEMLNNADEDLDPETECNLASQLIQPEYIIDTEEDRSKDMTLSNSVDINENK